MRVSAVGIYGQHAPMHQSSSVYSIWKPQVRYAKCLRQPHTFFRESSPPLRFQGKSRLGFHPLPISEAQRIRSFLHFPDAPSSAIDPCVGDGVAFEVITNGAAVVRYGIELDAYRAEQAGPRIPNI